MNKVKARRTPLVNYREMNACLDEEDYSDYEEEYCDYEYQQKSNFPLEDDKHSTAIGSTDANRKSITMEDFLVIDRMKSVHADNYPHEEDVHLHRPAMRLPPPMKVNDNIENTTVSYTHLTLPTILLV